MFPRTPRRYRGGTARREFWRGAGPQGRRPGVWRARAEMPDGRPRVWLPVRQKASIEGLHRVCALRDAALPGEVVAESARKRTPPVSENGRYRIQSVAEMTGVSAATLRAWERRYGIPAPRRTAAAYRPVSYTHLTLPTNREV